ncbi:hypothetical protein HMPREF1624_05687 [Sporothrix schenckii ATCC 58251]|uniref:SET domain-containing protein n=1 Tax=Sporothrix schenckii (strain ATCC 58251 / de Perez 2211183) TaxID=1391915 RepID=U7PPG1_SPOS1|nr:hypothetical protein HMPREF1624_05687 [Sporothrix schenckii ATCC 58251]
MADPSRSTAPVVHIHKASMLLFLAASSTLVTAASAARDYSSINVDLPLPQVGQCAWSKYGYPMPTTDQDVCPRPVSDLSSSFAPWSYPPYCIRAPMNATVPDPEAGDARVSAGGRKYCVYTARTFRGRGLSVISTPQGAANLVASLDDTRVLPRLRDHPASSMAKRDARRDAWRPYVIKNVAPGRGKGLVARRRVPKWGEALVGFPIMVARTDFLEALPDADRQALEDRALQQLPAMAQEAILALAHGGAGAGDKEHLLEDIFRSNIFGIEIAGVHHFSLQVEGSRINHDCRPNTFWRYSPSTMTHEVVAFREISIGEEFTHSYLPLGLALKDRQESIRRWGFSCHCSLCMAPKNLAFASDIRRTRLVEIYTTMEDEAAQGLLTRDTIETLLAEMMLLINGEDLVPQLCEYYAMIARAYLSIEAFDDARHYAQQSEEYWIRYGTEEHDNVDAVRALWKQIAAKEKAVAERRRHQDAAQSSKL